MLVFAGIWHFFGRIWHFLQGFCQKSTKQVPNPCKNQHFCAFWGGARISRLVPDWFPTGSRLVPNLPKAVLKFAESGVRFWPEICRIGWFLRIWEVFWWVWGGWGLVWGCSGGFGGWFWGGWGGGLGFGKVSGDFWWFGKMGEDFWGFGGFGKIWRGLEGFWRVEWFLVIFYRYVTPLVSIGMVFYFSKSGNALPCW